MTKDDEIALVQHLNSISEFAKQVKAALDSHKARIEHIASELAVVGKVIRRVVESSPDPTLAPDLTEIVDQHYAPKKAPAEEVSVGSNTVH
jgi:hypothetical protein